MKKKIAQINNSIDAKCIQLKSQIEKEFGSIANLSYPSHSGQSEDGRIMDSITDSKSLIPKLLYSCSALLVIGAIGAKCFDWIQHRTMGEDDQQKEANNPSGKLLLAALISAAGGFVLSKVHPLNSWVASSKETTNHIDDMDIKNEIISMGIAIVKNISNEWEEFMENNQKELFAFIDASSMSESQKDSLSSMIYSSEVININLSELIATVNDASSLLEIAENLEDFKSKLNLSIDLAVKKQKGKYDSLNSQLLFKAE